MTETILDTLDRQLTAGEAALPLYKTALRDHRASLASRFAIGNPVQELVREAAAFTDALLFGPRTGLRSTKSFMVSEASLTSVPAAAR